MTDVSLLQDLAATRPEMALIRAGRYRMGSSNFYPEEAPPRWVAVDGFLMDTAPVTHRQFAAFVQATGYVTVAERPLRAEDHPGLAPEHRLAGAAVFDPAPVPGHPGWWHFRPGANWRAPQGPGYPPYPPDLPLDDHPVVQIACEDAEAYAAWCGKALPTEAEWEFAARGGLVDADYAWGDELAPQGRMMANYWQGAFPHVNDATDGWVRTSPVGSFPANGHGLVDMIGNVWEWTADWWSLPARSAPSASCCAAHNPRGGPQAGSADGLGASAVPRRVIKGGSHLCAPNYCRRYRPAARHPQPVDSPTSHIGFRCVVRPGH